MLALALAGCLSLGRDHVLVIEVPAGASADLRGLSGSVEVAVVAGTLAGPDLHFTPADGQVQVDGVDTVRVLTLDLPTPPPPAAAVAAALAPLSVYEGGHRLQLRGLPPSPFLVDLARALAQSTTTDLAIELPAASCAADWLADVPIQELIPRGGGPLAPRCSGGWALTTIAADTLPDDPRRVHLYAEDWTLDRVRAAQSALQAAAALHPPRVPGAP